MMMIASKAGRTCQVFSLGNMDGKIGEKKALKLGLEPYQAVSLTVFRLPDAKPNVHGDAPPGARLIKRTQA